MFDFKNFGYTNLTNLIVCLISLLGGFFTSKFLNRRPFRIDVLQKQLNLVYSPLFKKLEPNLYKSINKQIANDYIAFFNSIKFQYYDLIDCNTLLYFSKFEKKCNSNSYYFLNEFYDFCHSVDKNFEKIRKSLGLPTRNFKYKLYNGQYLIIIKFFVSDTSILLLRIAFILNLTFFIYSIIQLLSSSITSMFN